MNKPVESSSAALVPLWIGGRKQAASSSRHGPVTNPATGVVTRRVPFCSAADVDPVSAAT